MMLCHFLCLLTRLVSVEWGKRRYKCKGFLKYLGGGRQNGTLAVERKDEDIP